MTRMRAVRGVGGATVPSRSRSWSGDDHPLLRLQRQAGNQATTLLVQREKRDLLSYPFSKVALAETELLYDGRLNADIEGASLTRVWDPGLLASDRYIKLNAGPVTFSFRSAQTRIFGDKFPWSMGLARKGTAWVVGAVSDALETIYQRWDKEDDKFWSAVATLKAMLKADVDAWRAYRKRNPLRPWWGSDED